MTISAIPNSFAFETATANPRALNVPVGFRDSSFIQRLENFFDWSMGVTPSP